MKKTNYLIILSAILLLVSSCGKGFSEGGYFANAKAMVNEARKGIEEISYDELIQKLESSELRFIIDVREPGEFAEGYINQPDENDEKEYPDTITKNIPRGLLEFKIADITFWKNRKNMPSKDDEIIIYCKKGGRGALATETLMKLGYKNIQNLKGGYKKWLNPNESETEDTPAESGGCG
ncbi:MAG: rhodanese-like domain-containing protein [Candidatus Cloacimonetes bacterium]|nr:rhodanese-like domain-containing protein [Candidatus Cloacimonadota bacterium]